MFGAEKSSISSLRRMPVLKTSLKCKNNFAMIWSSNFEPWWHDERSKVEVYCARHWDRIPVCCDDAHMGCAMVLHNPFLRKLFPPFLQTILKQLYLGCVKDCPIMFCIVDCRIILDLLKSVKKLIFASNFKSHLSLAHCSLVRLLTRWLMVSLMASSPAPSPSSVRSA